MNEIRILIRHFDPDGDSGMIFGTMLKGIYFGSKRYKQIHLRDFMGPKQEYLVDLVEKADIYIACTSDDADTVLGYAILYQGILEWVFVKPIFRRQGIASLLLKNKDFKAINEKNLTNAGFDFLSKNHPELLKEETNEQNPSQTN